MRVISKGPSAAILAVATAFAAPTALSAQDGVLVTSDNPYLTIDGSRLVEGPEIEGVITARTGEKVQITMANGQTTTVIIDEQTEIKASGGFLGLDKDRLTANQLLNGIPVDIKTLQGDNILYAQRISLKNKDLKTAAMIRNATSQRFAEQGARIGKNEEGIAANAAATEALRGRFGDIDQYNLKGVTNVYFDTGRYNLSAQARAELCEIAEQAEQMDNALLLVVGYTDSTGSYEINQELSEKRASRVVNYLQQQCSWKPYRMLTPTGMAEADPTASNDTVEGRAQNRRVAVNILVSKAVDES